MSEASTSTIELDRASSTDHSSDPHHARRWLILVVIALAQLMVVLDATVVTIALPTAQHDLGFSNDARQWVVTAYALAFGSLLLLGGRVADLFGRKRALMIGLAGFATASAIGGAANGFDMLVVARAAQGLFGALLAPAALSLLTTTFTDVKERGRAFGIFGAIAGGGAALGLLLGGALTEYLDWRWCMFVNIVFAVIALIGAAVLLRHQRNSGSRPKLDMPGTITSLVGLFSLVYGFGNAETHAWGSPLVWGFLVAGVALIAVFVAIQTRVAHPLLPMRVVLDRNRGGAYLTVFLLSIGMFGIFLFLTYYMQQNLGFSSVVTGVAFLPMVGGLMTTATTSTAILLPRFGAKWLVTAGMVIAAAGLFWLGGLHTGSTYANGVLFPLIVIGLGIGLAMAPAMNVATSGVAASDAGVASATVNTAQQIGGSIGTALLSSIAANAITSFVAGRTPTPQLLAQAAVHSYSTAFIWSAALFLGSAIICGALLRRGVMDPNPSDMPVVHA
ncbi:MAG TPA: MFS transporter [Pseudonocardiaceae bacterium]|jgi:EmrB/QacA subfamily drug resistance transporter|nr:MFS transporter [Pseudonocardiaceae bacterium]